MIVLRMSSATRGSSPVVETGHPVGAVPPAGRYGTGAHRSAPSSAAPSVPYSAHRGCAGHSRPGRARGVGDPRHRGHGPGGGRPGRRGAARRGGDQRGGPRHVRHRQLAARLRRPSWSTRTPGVPWADVVVFHMDEYVGIGPDHPASFQRWIRQRIVEPTRPRAAHYLDGRATARGRVRAATPAARPTTPSTSAAWGSARTATWPSTTRRWPTSTTRST